MADMITNSDYEKSVLLGDFVKEVRDIATKKQTVTDIRFAPAVGGYEVRFVYGGKNIQVNAEVKGFFTKKLIIKKYVDGKKAAKYKVHRKEEISFCTEQIITE